MINSKTTEWRSEIWSTHDRVTTLHTPILASLPMQGNHGVGTFDDISGAKNRIKCFWFSRSGPHRITHHPLFLTYVHITILHIDHVSQR